MEEVESQEFSSTEVEPRALHVTILNVSWGQGSNSQCCPSLSVYEFRLGPWTLFPENRAKDFSDFLHECSLL